MSDGVTGLLEVHACACNGRAWDTLDGHWGPHAICLRDGLVEGEGREALRKALSEEFGDGLIGRVMDIDGSPAIVAFDGPEGNGEPRLVVRLEAFGDRVATCRIDHPAPP